MSKPVLYSYFRSSASWRVRIALSFKHIDYEYKAINLIKDGGQHLQECYLKLNPLGQVPSLIIDGKTLTQSARQLAEVINSGIQPLQNLSVLKKLEDMTGHADAKSEWAKHWITKGLDGKFCIGDEVTIADICLIPQLFNARRNGVDLSQFPKVLKIEEECNKLECFKIAHSDYQPDAAK